MYQTLSVRSEHCTRCKRAIQPYNLCLLLKWLRAVLVDIGDHASPSCALLLFPVPKVAFSFLITPFRGP